MLVYLCITTKNSAYNVLCSQLLPCDIIVGCTDRNLIFCSYEVCQSLAGATNLVWTLQAHKDEPYHTPHVVENKHPVYSFVRH